MANTRSPQQSPSYALHRERISAVDSLPVTDSGLGINMKGYLRANIQVVPSGGANPSVLVLWWSEAAGRFIQEHVPIARAGVGANTAFEFSIDCNGRIMFVAFTALAAGLVDVRVAGSEHELVT